MGIVVNKQESTNPHMGATGNREYTVFSTKYWTLRIASSSRRICQRRSIDIEVKVNQWRLPRRNELGEVYRLASMTANPKLTTKISGRY